MKGWWVYLHPTDSIWSKSMRCALLWRAVIKNCQSVKIKIWNAHIQFMHKNPSVWVCTLIWVVESEDMVFTNDDPGPCFQFCFLRYLFTIYIHNSTFNGQQSHFSCKITITLCNFLSTWKKKIFKSSQKWYMYMNITHLLQLRSVAGLKFCAICAGYCALMS